MRNRVRLFFAAALVALAVLHLPVGISWAQSLDDLRASGAVGERFDGYLEARDPSAQGFVDRVNAKRREIYASRAAAQGVTVQEVGMVYAKSILADSPAGTWFLTASGAWRQK
ncbi:MAG: YdbL family protein [Kiloniellaceae bacterium]